MVHPRQRSPHQRRAVGVGEAVGYAEGLYALLVGQQADGPRPVGAPEAAVEAVGVEDAAQGLPDVGVGEGFVGEGAGAGNLDDHVVQLRRGQHVGQVGEGLGRGRRHEGLGQAHVVYDDRGFGVAAGQLGEQGQFAGGHDVDRHAGPGAGAAPAVRLPMGRRCCHWRRAALG